MTRQYTMSEIAQLSTHFQPRANLLSQWSHIRVAGADARNAANADLVCDGIDDQVELMEAVASLPTQGGLVECIGNFVLSEPFRIGRDQITIQGHGTGQRTVGGDSPPSPDTQGWGTRFSAANGFVGPVIQVEKWPTGSPPTVSRPLHEISLSGFMVDGRLQAGVTDGILFKCLRSHMERINAFGCQNGITIQGINGGNKTLDNFFRFIITSHNTAAGFRFYLQSPDNHLVGLVSHANQDGLLFQQSASSQQIVDIHTYGNERNGIRISETGARIKLTNLKCENNGEDGIFVDGTDLETEETGNSPVDLMFNQMGFKNNGWKFDPDFVPPEPTPEDPFAHLVHYEYSHITLRSTPEILGDEDPETFDPTKRPTMSRAKFLNMNFGHISGGEKENRAAYLINIFDTRIWDSEFGNYTWQQNSYRPDRGPIRNRGTRTVLNGLSPNTNTPWNHGHWKPTEHPEVLEDLGAIPPILAKAAKPVDYWGQEGVMVRDTLTNKFYIYSPGDAKPVIPDPETGLPDVTYNPWHGTLQRAATKIVAAALTDWESPDYQCDGTDDSVEINQALVDANALVEGGDVLLSNGTFYLHQAILPKSNTRLILSKGTVLYMGDGENLVNMVSFVSVSNAQITGAGQLNGNKVNQTAGTNAIINISGGSSDITVDGNLRLRNGYLRGIYVGSGNTNVVIQDVLVEDCNAQGIEVNNDRTRVINPIVRRCGSTTDPHGIRVTADAVDLVNPTVEDIAGKGIEFWEAKSFSLRGGTVRRCSKFGILVTHSGLAADATLALSSAWSKIQGVTVENCLDDGLMLNYVTGFSVSGCHFNFNGSPRSASDIREGSGILVFRCTHGTITGNVCISNSQGQTASGADWRSGIRITGDATNRPSSQLTIGSNTCVDLRANDGFTALLNEGFGITDTQTTITIDTVVGVVPQDGNFTMLIDAEPVVVTNSNGGLPGTWTVIRGKTDATGDAQAIAHGDNAPLTLRITQNYGIDIKDDATMITSFVVKNNIVSPNRTGGVRNNPSADAARIVGDNI